MIYFWNGVHARASTAYWLDACLIVIRWLTNWPLLAGSWPFRRCTCAFEPRTLSVQMAIYIVVVYLITCISVQMAI
jgi:hypothetical protein